MSLDGPVNSSVPEPDWYSTMVSSLTSGEVELTMQDLEQLAGYDLPSTTAMLSARLGSTAHDRVMWARTNGSDSSQYGRGPSFREMPSSRHMFGTTPEGQSLSGQVTAAHEVYLETVRGVVADLERFRGNLVDSIKKAKDADQGAEDAMRRLARREPDEYRMDAAQQRAVERHRDVLEFGLGDAGVTVEPAAAGAAATESAAYGDAREAASSLPSEPLPNADIPSSAAPPTTDTPVSSSAPPAPDVPVPASPPRTGEVTETFEPDVPNP